MKKPNAAIRDADAALEVTVSPLCCLARYTELYLLDF